MDIARERGRLILWLPVAFGAGIACYFALGEEPARWIGPWGLCLALALGLGLRRHGLAVIVALALGGVSLGFVAAVERSRAVAHPVLARSTGIIEIEGRVVDVEPMEEGVRVVLDDVRFAGRRGRDALPERVRIRLKRFDTPLLPGQRIALKAGLSPPGPPVAPGAYDFARVAWFQELGAVGFAVGMPAVLAGNTARDGMAGTAGRHVLSMRLALTERIRTIIDEAGLPAGTGAVAAALITGEQSAIDGPTVVAYRDSGLAHILSISGLHMTMAAGLFFVVLRFALAAIPRLALNHDTKKWAAAGAIAGAACYLCLSGAPVPAQRSFIMTAIVFGAVLLDRDALSLRSVGWAAAAILAVQPEALVGASFQMSFAAVYALIAAYEVLGGRFLSWRQSHPGWIAAILLYLGGVLLTTQVAGSATAFFAAYHFNRYASYALLANAAAVPLFGFWIMPASIVALLLAPFGLDGPAWIVVGWGVALMGAIASGVADLPGAVLDLPRMPMSTLVLFTGGGLWLVLWRSSLRLAGLPVMALSMVLWAVERPPDLLIDGAGKLLAVRTGNGELSFSGKVAAKRSRLSWARLAGQGEDGPVWADGKGAEMPACDSLGCVHRVEGRALAFAKSALALAADCRRADLVVVPVAYGGPCPSARLVIDAAALKAKGTHALWIEKDGYRVETVADWQGRRPWSPFATKPPHDRGVPRSRVAVPEPDEGVNSDASTPPDDPEP